MKGLFKGIFLFLSMAVVLICWGSVFAQAKRDPDTAYDPTNNRYLMVWEEEGSGGSNIVAQFRNPDGSAVAGSPTVISDPRPTQGCFYGQFDTQNGDITTPTNCPTNKNPSVAYNNGQYIVVWEVHGTASAPSSAPDNEFVNIFAQIINANTLAPLPGWEEGILISKIFIAANNAESSCGDRHACNDGQIQAWSQSINPDVAPRVGGQGFVVTWQTNKDYIGCADPDRRHAWSVYGRYIDQDFSATSTTNPAAFAVYKDDSTIAENCEAPSNVDNGVNPRIAVNQTNNDFVIVYEVARASGGNASIGAKRVTLDSGNVGQVSGSIMPDVVASVSGSSLNNPDIASFKNNYVLIVSDGSNLRAKSFSSSTISVTTPDVISLGDGSKINPRIASNLGIGGQRSGTNPSPERLLLGYENGGNIFVATINEALAVTRGPENISSGMGTSNRSVELASDIHNFLASWGGQDSGEQVYAEFVTSSDGGVTSPTPNTPPTAPGLQSPNDGVTFAPIRAYISWNASTDVDSDPITYRIYFGENVIPATPQVTGVTGTHFVIGPETFGMTGITLQSSKVYKWKVEADDGQGGLTSSPVRTLNTDNSVVGWWRFDENPAGPVCTGGAAGETVCDSSTRNNHGVPTGTPTWIPPPSAGILGGAINFDGTNDKIDVQHDSSLNVGLSGWTVSCKINPQTVATNTEIITKDNPSTGPYSLALTTANNIVFGIYNSSAWSYANGDFTGLLGTNFRATGIYDGASASLYFGTTLKQSTAAAGVVVNNTNALKIGFSPFIAGYYKGVMDECILVNKTMGTAEEANLVNSDN